MILPGFTAAATIYKGYIYPGIWNGTRKESNIDPAQTELEDSVRLPCIHGRWCGPGCSGPGPPIDEIDACCKAHDECYERRGYWDCVCDNELLNCLRPLQDRFVARLVYNYFYTQYYWRCARPRPADAPSIPPDAFEPRPAPLDPRCAVEDEFGRCVQCKPGYWLDSSGGGCTDVCPNGGKIGDDNNCRGCGDPCPSDRPVCRDNQCQCPPGRISQFGRCDVPGTCAACDERSDCPPGTACVFGKCFPSHDPDPGPLLGACTRGPYSDGCYRGVYEANGRSVCVRSDCPGSNEC